MSQALVLRWRPAPRRLPTRWRGPDRRVLSVPQAAQAPSLAAIIGPPGKNGRDGTDGLGANFDPGDVTLVFDNHLI